MPEYINRDDFIEKERKQYCADCDRRKGMKRGKMCVLYDVGDAPCRACSVEDVLSDLEDFPSAEKRGEWVWDEDGMDWGLGAWRCSACGTRPGTWWQGDHRAVPMRCSGSKFCGNCGAEMEKGD